MSDYRPATHMYNGRFDAPSFYKGKKVVCKSRVYDYAGPGIDGQERTYSSTGSFIHNWRMEDPANRTPKNMHAIGQKRAKARNKLACVSEAMIRYYERGRFDKVWDMQPIPVAEFPVWINKNLANLKKNTRLQKFKFEMVELDGQAYMMVYVLDANGKRTFNHYEWKCCQPKKVYSLSLGDIMSTQEYETSGYGIIGDDDIDIKDFKATDERSA